MDRTPKVHRGFPIGSNERQCVTNQTDAISGARQTQLAKSGDQLKRPDAGNLVAGLGTAKGSNDISANGFSETE